MGVFGRTKQPILVSGTDWWYDSFTSKTPTTHALIIQAIYTTYSWGNPGKEDGFYAITITAILGWHGAWYLVSEFEKLFDISYDPMAILNLDGKFTIINLAFSHTLGWNIRELIGIHFWEIIFPDEQVNLASIQQILSKGHPVFFIDSQVRCRNGEPHLLRWTAYPDHESETIALILSEPKTHEKEHKMFKLAAEASPTVILVVSKTEILYANQLVEMVFGYSKDELIGRPVEVLVPPHLLATHQRHRSQYDQKPYLRLMATTRNLSGRRKDGSEFPVDVGLNPVQTQDGPVVVCSVIDLTKRKATEKGITQKIQNMEGKIAELDKLSKTDELTSIKNRRALDMQIELHYRIAQKKGEAISFILLDIDNFKYYNDAFGHLAGDEVLKFIAKIMTTHLRRSEIVARFGGEEFGIILPENNVRDVTRTAERLRKAIEKFECPFQHITVSLGCATIIPKLDPIADTEDIRNFIRMADRALYVSKRSGKNRVTHFDQLVLNPEEKLSDWKNQYETPQDH